MCRSHVNDYMITCGGQEIIASCSHCYRGEHVACALHQGLSRLYFFGEVGLVYSASENDCCCKEATDHSTEG